MGSPTALQIIKDIRTMEEISGQLRKEGRRIALIPTMGYLHKGHTSLIERARSISDTVVTSIFVNPTQFGPNEDYSRYPRDFEKDRFTAQAAGTDIIFYPDASDMYPDTFSSEVTVQGPSSVLEGAFRPNHFRGVTTVVAKLFNIIKPHTAVFGQKDAQQAFIVKKMVRDLNFDIEINVAPIVREKDGLAMSSRNIYLKSGERTNATVLYRSLLLASEIIQKGERSAAALRSSMTEVIRSGSPSQVDYISFVDPYTFTEMEKLEPPEVLVLLAVRFGTTRLIDNSIIPITV